MDTMDRGETTIPHPRSDHCTVHGCALIAWRNGVLMTMPLRVTCAVPVFNAGDTVRGIEIAKAIRDIGRERGQEADVEFVHPRTANGFEEQIRGAGFRARPVDFSLGEAEVAAIMHADHAGEEFGRDPATAGRFIDVCRAELERRRPDLLVFGFLPPVGIAAQLLRVPAVAFLPFPAYEPWVRRHFLHDIPDELGVAIRAPRPLRRALAAAASRLVVRRRFFTQPALAAAARARGWSPPNPNLFAMLDADIQLVNDLPGFYAGQNVGPRTCLTGPLFSRPADAEVVPEIAKHLEPRGRPRVFVSLGSSGEKPYLLAAIDAVANVPCRAVVVAPPHVCDLAEAKARAAGSPHVLLTSAFVPAHLVNAMADYAIIHGGQGTVQTAVACGTPVVGVGMQVEQCANLDRLVRQRAGIRIPRRHWCAETVAQALRRLIASPAYREGAGELKAEFDRIDGWRVSGELIWDLARPRTATA